MARGADREIEIAPRRHPLLREIAEEEARERGEKKAKESKVPPRSERGRKNQETGFLRTPDGEILFEDPGSQTGEMILRFLARQDRKTLGLWPGAKAEGLDFSGQTLNHTRFAASHLSTSKFAGANLEGSSFESGADLSFCDFSNAYAANVSARGANAEGSNWSGGNLRSAYFIKTAFHKADLSNTDLRGATFDNCYLVDSKLEGARTEKTTFRFSHIRVRAKGHQFVSCNMHGIDTRGSDFSGASFRLCNLDYASFVGATIVGADMRETRLRGASFAGCDLTGVDLRGCDLSEVNLEHTGYDSFFGRRRLRRGDNLL